MRKKLLLITVKYLPIIQMMGFLLNNTLVCFDYIGNLKYDIDFSLGSSIINILALIIISFGLHYCLWHRLLLTANGINICIAWYDARDKFPIEDRTMLAIYYIIAAIFIIIGTYTHIKYDRNKTENQID